MAQKWKSKLRPGSFRGVKFFVDQSTYGSGRRGPDNEFPDRDIPYADDTGRKQRKYDIQAHLVGSDYLTLKNKLITACETRGPGELVHPYYGKVRVQVRDFSVEEKSGEGGFVTLNIKFVEAGLLSFPKVGADSGFLVSNSADGLNSAVQGDFADKFSVANQPQFSIDSATDKVAAISDKLSDVTSGISGSASGIAELAFSIRNLKATARDLVGTPAKLAAQLDNAFSLLQGALNPADVFAACKNMFKFGADDPAILPTTTTRETQKKNLGSLNNITQTLAVIYASTAATDLDFTSVEDATQIRDQLGDQLDDLMETTESDEVYSTLQDLRAQVVRAIPPSDQTLAHVSNYTPITTVPSLVVSFDLYGNTDQEQDIIDRNNLRNPSFVQGGVTLEVLDRG